MFFYSLLFEFQKICMFILSCSVMSDLRYPMECSPPGSSVHGILQTRMLEWVVHSSRGSSQLRDQTQVSCISGRFFTVWATREPIMSCHCNHSQVLDLEALVWVRCPSSVLYQPPLLSPVAALTTLYNNCALAVLSTCTESDQLGGRSQVLVIILIPVPRAWQALNDCILE